MKTIYFHQSSAVITCSKSSSWMLPTHKLIISPLPADSTLKFKTRNGGTCHKQPFKRKFYSEE